MDEKVIRLECLKLASNVTRDQVDLLARAKGFEEYVTGPKEIAKSSEGSNKNQKKAQNPDNSIFK